jgi:hypothetical protein
MDHHGTDCSFSFAPSVSPPDTATRTLLAPEKSHLHRAQEMTCAAFLYFFAWMNVGELNGWTNVFIRRDLLWMDVCVHASVY